ncbi:arginine--tRNA ligase [endosymbiont of Euscepes postfasciatus]|uniref:arginine--tRNA ligase n=1 Tax=endosymbiont of Euscepes postfasciatus TaxID=650377 RepID=UPI000DC6E6E0|nr:arginine--tRNA ligase [endosymbiont of Euscepes postfasciatus]BBA84630.1 arginine--tRNA ligase [endosymbiont of Euscepes postfasciatus]
MLNIKKFLFDFIKNFLAKKKIIYNINLIKIKFIKYRKFGDYQIYGIKNLEDKINKKNNYLFIINNLKLELKKINFIKEINIINFNFINIFLKKEWMEKELKKILISKRLNISKKKNQNNIVIDYSSPNMSKEMHAGHLRSSILGDSFFRISKFLGYNVIKINHIGDWGINFGMIINEIKIRNIENKISNLSISDLELIYINSKNKFNTDKNFKIKSNYYFKQLIDNNKKYVKIWKSIINLSTKNNDKIYKLLDLKLNNNDILGESFYKKFIPFIIKDLKNKKIAIKKNKSIIAPLRNYKNKFGKMMSVVLRKKKIYLYSITEIASIRYRCKYLFADRIIYFIDKRQKDHLLYSLHISKKANYINENVRFDHYSFGMILDNNKQPFKTRNKNNLKLIKLINKYIEKTKEFIINKNKLLLDNKKEMENISKIIAIGSLKYFDLSKNRLTDYIIDWNKIFLLNNNKLIYIYYSYMRINSIFNKINIKNLSKIKFIKKSNINISNNNELNISILIVRFEEILETVINYGTFNILCNYIYELSIEFTNYYHNNNFLLLEKNKYNSLNLILLISKIIKIGLYFLGIKIPKKI